MFAFGLGYGEILVISLIALLLFGNRLPEVLRELGQCVEQLRNSGDGLDLERGLVVFLAALLITICVLAALVVVFKYLGV